MSEFEKLLTAVSAAPANTDFATLVKLMRSAGFELRMGKKQHGIFTSRIHRRMINVAKPHHEPVKPVYVRECLKTIAEVFAFREKD